MAQVPTPPTPLPSADITKQSRHRSTMHSLFQSPSQCTAPDSQYQATLVASTIQAPRFTFCLLHRKLQWNFNLRPPPVTCCSPNMNALRCFRAFADVFLRPGISSSPFSAWPRLTQRLGLSATCSLKSGEKSLLRQRGTSSPRLPRHPVLPPSSQVSHCHGATRLSSSPQKKESSEGWDLHSYNLSQYHAQGQ